MSKVETVIDGGRPQVGGGPYHDRQARHVEAGLRDEELRLGDLFGEDDMAARRGHPEGVFLGGERRGRHHAASSGQRIGRLPGERCREAGGQDENRSQEPHVQY